MNDTQFLKNVGNRIRQARHAQKLSQVTLGKKVSLDDASVSMIENGHKNVHILNLKHIAEVLNIDLKDLFLCDG